MDQIESPSIDTKRSLRRIQIVGYLSMLVMAGTLGAWSVTAEMNGAVIAPATIMVESYSKKVQQREGGVVRRILVREGDRVTEGQELVLLDPRETKAELGIVDGLLDEALIKRARLEAQRDEAREMELPRELAARSADAKLQDILLSQKKLLAAASEAVQAKRNQQQQQIAQIEEQIGGITAQIESRKRQLELINSELVNLRKLLKQGLVPVNRVLNLEREAAQLEGSIAELRGSKAAAEAKIGEVNLRLIELKEANISDTLKELRDTEAKIGELQERKISAGARLERVVIKAPITGTIYQMTVHTEGGVVAPGETIMLITPEGDDLILQAQVAPKDIANVTENLHARVRFPSFNARLTPEIHAVVSQVAADTTRMDQQTPPFYSVRLKISADELKKLGHNKLKPGMNAEAFIQTSARTPFSYLMKPLWDNIAHTFSEN